MLDLGGENTVLKPVVILVSVAVSFSTVTGATKQYGVRPIKYRSRQAVSFSAISTVQWPGKIAICVLGVITRSGKVVNHPIVSG